MAVKVKDRSLSGAGHKPQAENTRYDRYGPRCHYMSQKWKFHLVTLLVLLHDRNFRCRNHLHSKTLSASRNSHRLDAPGDLWIHSVCWSSIQINQKAWVSLRRLCITRRRSVSLLAYNCVCVLISQSLPSASHKRASCRSPWSACVRATGRARG